MEKLIVYFVVGCLIFCTSHSAPSSNKGEDKEIDEVKELENLRDVANQPPKSTNTGSSTEQPSTEAPKPQPDPSIFRQRTNKKDSWKVEYSPEDVANYVWQTGDEEGVAVAVEQLVREGMMGRTDAINYLQDVKQILRDMQKKTLEEVKSTTEPPLVTSPVSQEEPPLKAFTFDVIYKLAKDMFTQSILRDDPSAEETLSGLVRFLEKEVGQKHISLQMKEKILETVSSALVDSLRDYEGFLSQNEQAGEAYPHGLENNKSKVSMPEFYHKMFAKGPENLASTNRNRSS